MILECNCVSCWKKSISCCFDTFLSPVVKRNAVAVVVVVVVLAVVVVAVAVAVAVSHLAAAESREEI